MSYRAVGLTWTANYIGRPGRRKASLGREFTLEAPIVNGVGKVDVDDSTWRVRGPNLPAGSQIRVTRIDGVVLVVEAAR